MERSNRLIFGSKFILTAVTTPIPLIARPATAMALELGTAEEVFLFTMDQDTDIPAVITMAAVITGEDIGGLNFTTVIEEAAVITATTEKK